MNSDKSLNDVVEAHKQHIAALQEDPARTSYASRQSYCGDSSGEYTSSWNERKTQCMRKTYFLDKQIVLRD